MVNFTQEQKNILTSIEVTVRKKSLPFFKIKKSFYIYGGTGTGKTTIIEHFAMNSKMPALFMHFHDYLLDITRLATKMPLQKIAKEIAKNFKILCFDEFFIESIADAKILHDIFTHLIKLKVGIIATSNFKPEDLYKDGFNRNLVFPAFSNFINEEMFVIAIQEKQDFRITNNNTLKQIAFKNINEFQEIFGITIFRKNEEITVDKNHNLEIAGRFNNGIIIDYGFFKKHSSIKDYRHISRTNGHIHIENMQTFHIQNEDEAIRFRNFVDILYMRSTILTYCGKGNELFSIELLTNIKFKRCNSRLIQMATQKYQESQYYSFKRKANIEAFTFFQSVEI